MILYVNGDSHAAAAEAVVPHAWACDDGLYWGLGQQPHPDNERVSFGCELANWLNAILYLDAQSGCSNARIMRTTRDWIGQQTESVLKDTFVVIQWTTWEREEWWHQGKDYQVNASGTDHVPNELQEQYKKFVVNIDWPLCTRRAHEQIWEFHCYLKSLGIRHLMFNGNSHFGMPYCNEQKLMVPVIPQDQRQDWGASYIAPYLPEMTYNSVLKNNGFEWVNPASYHFGADAHCFWGEYLLQYIKTHNLLNT
jgi:hypothetical protein